MNREHAIVRYVASLAEEEVPPSFRNPYHRPQPAHNLITFLSRRDFASTTVLLVGEAPGYRGAAVSGVPFASLSTLLESWDPWGQFGSSVGYLAPDDARYVREATATMVWDSLAEHLADQPFPLTWNAIPFHPVGSKPDSNASPSNVDLGVPWLERLIELFVNPMLVAVGTKACDALHHVSAPHFSVRHPSRGGKSQFTAGIRSVRHYLTGQLERGSDLCIRLGRDPEPPADIESTSAISQARLPEDS